MTKRVQYVLISFVAYVHALILIQACRLTARQSQKAVPAVPVFRALIW